MSAATVGIMIVAATLGEVTAEWRSCTLLLPGPWGQRRLTRHLCQGRPQWLLTAWLIATQWRARAPAATRDRLQQRQAQCERRSLSGRARWHVKEMALRSKSSMAESVPEDCWTPDYGHHAWQMTSRTKHQCRQTDLHWTSEPYAAKDRRPCQPSSLDVSHNLAGTMSALLRR